jgi:endonuclease/exonuclease/phosphatase family metal-dependent hydrolase
LTRRKVLAVRRLGFTYSRREPRNALDVDLEVAGAAVRVIVTHLGLVPAERRYQVKALLEVLRSTPAQERLVVLGDINEWLPLSRPLRWLHELLGHSPAERSFPRARRDRLRSPAGESPRRHPGVAQRFLRCAA